MSSLDRGNREPKAVDARDLSPSSGFVDSAQRYDGSSNGEGLVTGTDVKAYKRALRKLDLFLLPTVTFIYFLNFLDSESAL